ncbi:hypothetical protein Sros_6159 [Streptosporangium roseum DSM 43021]|uniref:Uncharacterized protein n=1 Tax=Streptosporangium roseum (strain ATCC 12428 / DSM 43021 / JCM 3005 / KCTC 9067 / NCIMB 10171 / NRRL 2505 / NI 9100) TaxID=479432 RepID=D2AWW1_STRRD|nr:hypothetical protein Sros_6159 [Streptosporangium roseum DSM 43021]
MEAGERDVVAGLDAVNWSVVLNPGTAAGYGPRLVTDLWRAEAAEAAVRTLRRVCGVGEYLYPAAVELLPFMTLAAADPAVPVRALLVESIGEIAATAARAEALGRPMRLPAMASLRTGLGASAASQVRRVTAASWPSVWDRVVTDLCALLDDPVQPVRRSTAVALAQATGRAEEVTQLLQSRCAAEHDPVVAEHLLAALGELATHAAEPRRQEIVTWLQAHLTLGDAALAHGDPHPSPHNPHLTSADLHPNPGDLHPAPGDGRPADPHPNLGDGSSAGGGRPEVRVAVVRALRRVVPGHDDPAYARAVAEVLLDPGWRPSTQRADLFDLQASEVREIGELLGGDLPGLLALTRALLSHDRPEHRTGGLELAAALLADRRSAVPALLPALARLVDDPLPANRALALRTLAMCGTASRPWADAAAAHATPVGEPDPLVRTQALWALAKMGDDRCVPLLAVRMAAGPRRERRDGFRDWLPLSNVGRWSDLELNFCELLTPLHAHHRDLLLPLMAKMAARHDRLHYPLVLAAWHRAGVPVVPDLVELLDTEHALWAAHALGAIGPGPVVAGRERGLRKLLGPLDPGGRDPARIDPLIHWRLTGDTEPVLTALDSEDTLSWYRAEIYAELGPAAAGAAEWLRQELRTLPPLAALRHLRALWRVTGDAGEVVPALLALSAPGTGASDTVPALITLTEIAPTGEVLDRLRNLIHQARRLGHRHTLALARALWRHSRRAEEIVPALMTLVEQVTEPSGWLPRSRLEPLALLAEVAAADPEGVVPALPRLRALLDPGQRPFTYRNWRPVERRHWRSVEDDEALRAAARAVLDAGR